MKTGSGCLACQLTAGVRPLPGGPIHQSDLWRVEHSVGPLGVGTLIVKPLRHVTSVGALTAAEAGEMGPLLTQATRIVEQLVDPDQVYVCLWSHADRIPGHIHFVVQPARLEDMDRFDAHGPGLQMAMFQAAEGPDQEAVSEFCEQARQAWPSEIGDTHHGQKRA